jgi:NO-binding membrane sensor protein with MHYT domain
LVTVNNFGAGPFIPVLSYLVGCLGAFLGLRCVTRAYFYQGSSRTRWLICASIAFGATSIWGMHFIAMLGFSIPGQQITYNVPITLLSMVISIVTVFGGLAIVSYGKYSTARLLTAGTVVGLGASVMHYLGMAGMVMPYSMTYNPALFILSILVAIAAGIAMIWFGLRANSLGALFGATLAVGVGVSAMHYIGMAALQVHAGSMKMSAADSASGDAFLLPLLIGLILVTFVFSMMISLAPNAAQIRADAEFKQQLETLQHRTT